MPDNVRFIRETLEVAITVGAMEVVTIDVRTVQLPARVPRAEFCVVFIKNVLVKVRWVQRTFLD
jgi:hypothetical protein